METKDKFHFEFDSQCQISRIIYPKGITFSFFYDKHSRLSEVYDSCNGSIVFTYDIVDRIASVTSMGQKTSYLYDSCSNIIQVGYPSGEKVYFVRNPNGWITDIISDEQQIRYEYDSAGRLISESLPNGVASNYEYDSSGNLTSLTIRNRIGTALYSFCYSYDELGNCRSITRNNHGSRTTTSYAYDALSRLTEIRSDNGSLEKYCYDPLGNRTQKKSSDDFIGEKAFLRENGKVLKNPYKYNDKGQLTQSGKTKFAYDLSGNLISDGNMSLKYYDAGKLARVEFKNGTHCSYIYDFFGRRINKRLPNGECINYIYNGSDLIVEQDINGKNRATYVFGPYIDFPVKMQRNEKTFYFLKDNLNSIIAITDEKGEIVNEYQYDAWGNLTLEKETVENPFRYTGREWDKETGLYYYRARYYSPQTGRFITPDPVNGSLLNPQSLNKYTYVLNNPVDLVDPLGLIPTAPKILKPPPIPTPPKIPTLTNLSLSPNIIQPNFIQPLQPISNFNLNLNSTPPIHTPSFQQIQPPLQSLQPINLQISSASIPFSSTMFRQTSSFNSVQTQAGGASLLPPLNPRFVGFMNAGNPLSPQSHIQTAMNNAVGQLMTMIPNPSPGFSATLSGITVFQTIVSSVYSYWPVFHAFYNLSQPGASYQDFMTVQTQLVLPMALSLVPAIGTPVRIGMAIYGALPKNVQQSINTAVYQTTTTAANTFFYNMAQMLFGNYMTVEPIDLFSSSANNQQNSLTSSANGNQQSQPNSVASTLQNIDSTQSTSGNQSNNYPPGYHDDGGGGGSVGGGRGGGGGGGWGGEAGGGSVGGVLLDKAVKLDGAIGNIMGAYWDDELNQLVLVGEGGESSVSGLDEDLFATAIASVYCSGSPGVSIDRPTTESERELMPVRYLGNTKNTFFGAIMFEADRLLKNLSGGEDNVTHKKVTSVVPNFKSELELGLEMPHCTANTWHRMWFCIDDITLSLGPKEALDRRSLVFSNATLKLRTEYIDRADESSPSAEAFAQFFTEHYDEIAKEYPILQKLVELAKIAAVAKYLKETGKPINLPSLVNYPKAFVPTPDTTPGRECLKTISQYQGNTRYTRTNTLYGGVDFDFKYVAAADSKEAELMRKKAEQSRPFAAKKWVFESEGKQLTAVALNMGLPMGNFTLSKSDFNEKNRALEKVDVTRNYDSFDNTVGEFGLGWHLSLPHRLTVVNSIDQHEPIAILVESRNENRVRKYHPVGTEGNFCFVTCEANVANGLEYDPFDSIKQNGVNGFVWRTRFGSTCEFDIEGHLVSVANRAGNKINYVYSSNRLTEISSKTQRVTFDYDDLGRIQKTKTSNGSEISYQYDSEGKLTKVSHDDKIFESYYYDAFGRLTKAIDTGGHVLFRNYYDILGRAIKTVDQAATLKAGKQIQTIEPNKLLLTKEEIGLSEVSYTYDSQGNLLKANIQDTIDKTKLTEVEFNPAEENVKSIKNSAGETIKLYYDSNIKVSQIVDAKGHSTHFRRDDKGQLRAVCDPLGNIWETQTNPENGTIKLADPLGGYKKISYSDKEVQINTSGSVTRYVYDESGRPWKVFDPKGNVTQYNYDETGRLTSVKDAAGSNIRYEYDKTGKLASVYCNRRRLLALA